MVGVASSPGPSCCPECRTPFSSDDLNPPNRFMKNMLASIRLKCQFSGCQEIVGYEMFKNHKQNCENGPFSKIACAYCQLVYARKSQKAHRENCSEFIKLENVELTKSVANLEKKLESDEIAFGQMRLKVAQLTTGIREITEKLAKAHESVIIKVPILFSLFSLPENKKLWL